MFLFTIINFSSIFLVTFQLWKVEVGSSVTSMSLQGKLMAVGTIASEIYEVFLGDEEELLISQDQQGFPLVLEDYPNHQVQEIIQRQQTIISSASSSKNKNGERTKHKNNNGSQNKENDKKSKCSRYDKHQNGNSNRSAMENNSYSNKSILIKKSRVRASNQTSLHKETPPMRLLSTCHSDPIFDVKFPR